MKKTFNKSALTLDLSFKPKILLCSDVDETYIPYKEKDIIQSDLKKLETYIHKNYKKYSIVFCWVTGSSISKFKKKLRFINVKPHFIASSMGSEIHEVRSNGLKKVHSWNSKINKKKFKINAHKVIKKIKQKYFIKKETYANLRISFYVYNLNSNKELKNFKKKLLLLCNKNKLNFNLSKSCSSAGDPVNTYDLDILPYGCGKKEAMIFLKKKFSINNNKTITFGDSFNDFEIMKSSFYRFIVGNASKDVKESKNLQKKIILKNKYSKGILEGLKIIENKINNQI